MPLECCFNIRPRIFQRHSSVRVTFADPLGKQICNSQNLLLTGFPYTSQCDSGFYCTVVFGSVLFSEVLLHTLEECIDVLLDIFGIILFDDPLQRRTAVSSVLCNFSGGSRFQESFDVFEEVLSKGIMLW